MDRFNFFNGKMDQLDSYANKFRVFFFDKIRKLIAVDD